MRAPKSFEDGMARLETILSQMQSEETTLSESVKLYAEAASLMEYCHAALEKASLQMEEIDAARSEKEPACREEPLWRAQSIKNSMTNIWPVQKRH